MKVSREVFEGYVLDLACIRKVRKANYLNLGKLIQKNVP